MFEARCPEVSRGGLAVGGRKELKLAASNAATMMMAHQNAVELEASTTEEAVVRRFVMTNGDVREGKGRRGRRRRKSSGRRKGGRRRRVMELIERGEEEGREEEFGRKEEEEELEEDDEEEEMGEEEEGEEGKQQHFMADPFLALQNDLDDVSEVIKHNLVAESTSNSVEEGGGGEYAEHSPTSSLHASSPKSVEMKMLAAIKEGNGENNIRDAEAMLLTNNDSDPSREHKIGQILHLLQQPEKRHNFNQQHRSASFDDDLAMFPPDFFNSPQSVEMDGDDLAERRNLEYFGGEATTTTTTIAAVVQQQLDDPMIGGRERGEGEGNGGGNFCDVEGGGSLSFVPASSSSTTSGGSRNRIHFLQHTPLESFGQVIVDQQQTDFGYEMAEINTAAPERQQGTTATTYWQQRFAPSNQQIPNTLPLQNRHHHQTTTKITHQQNTAVNNFETVGEESPPPVEPFGERVAFIKQELQHCSVPTPNSSDEGGEQQQIGAGENALLMRTPQKATKKEILEMLLDSITSEELEQIRANRVWHAQQPNRHHHLNHQNQHHQHNYNQHYELQQQQQQNNLHHQQQQQHIFHTSNRPQQQPIFVHTAPPPPPSLLPHPQFLQQPTNTSRGGYCTSNNNNAVLLQFQQQQQQQQLCSPPLDPLPPPPPLPPFQMDFVGQTAAAAATQQHQVVAQYGLQQIMPKNSHHFFPSMCVAGSAGNLLSPLSGVSSNCFTTLAPGSRDFLEGNEVGEEGDEREEETNFDEDEADFWPAGQGEEMFLTGAENHPTAFECNNEKSDGLHGGGRTTKEQQGRRKPHKTERRTAHNLIEKKYRCSINDRINQLKGMLAGEESSTKLSKSATLRRAVEHIQALRSKNAELSCENGRLRQALEMNNNNSLRGSAPRAVASSALINNNNNCKQAILQPMPTATIVGQHVETPERLPLNKQQQLTQQNSSSGLGKFFRGERASSIRKCVVVSSAAASLTNSSSSHSSTSCSGPKDQSRVTLCVFMFLLLTYNPLGLFLTGNNNNNKNTSPSSGTNEMLLAEQADASEEAVFERHRTLSGDERFGAQFAQEPGVYSTASSSSSFLFSSSIASTSPPPPFYKNYASERWPFSPLLQHSLVWLMNCLFVFAILNRLLVSSEPVADRRSPRWGAFLQSRRKVAQAVTAGNWKEAQRQLDESLQLLERPIPSSGGLDEWMSIIWQVIRHLLNVLWIGRWFARRRRPSVQSQKSICRSHAATAMIYHQLHQLHLLDVDGIGLTQRGALNVALLAANLAESAGSSAISHALRAEIYICAGIRCRLCLPRWLRPAIAGYFFRRAKRHLTKSQRVEENKELVHSLKWAFHPLARKFLANPARLSQTLNGSGVQRQPNFPFSDSTQSAKPLEVLRDSFKMHLLGALLSQLDSAGGLRVPDFVERSQLLLQICADGGSGCEKERKKRRGDDLLALGSKGLGERSLTECVDLNGKDNDVLSDLLSPNALSGDELCTWWTHMLSGALHWRHGDLARARAHYAVVRQCPRELIQNDSALAVGLAFCSRKICLEDRQKAAWAELTLLHAQRAFAHLQRADRQHKLRLPAEGNAQGIEQIQRSFRLLCCQWILLSLLDLCSFSAGLERAAPLPVRQLYTNVLASLERDGAEQMEQKRLVTFKHLGKTICDADGTTSEVFQEKVGHFDRRPTFR